MSLPNVTNGTNSSAPIYKSPGAFQLDWLVEPTGVKVFKISLEVLIALFGVLGNILICCVVAKSPKMKSSTYYYIISLAIADLGVLLVNFPLAVVKEYMPLRWPFGEFFCLYIYPTTDIFFGASIWSIAVIAINRYRNIASRKKFRRGVPSKKSALFAIATVWIMSFVVMSLPVYFVITYNSAMEACHIRWPASKFGPVLRKVYMVTLTVFLYLLPLSIITFTYFFISRRLHASNTFLKTLRSTNGSEGEGSEFLKKEEKKMMKKNKKAKKILTPLVILFAVSMLPLNVFRLVMTFYPKFLIWRYYWVSFSVVIAFTIINSSCNPIVYAVVSKEFRRGFKNLFNCRCAKNVQGKNVRCSPPTKSTEKDQIALGPVQTSCFSSAELNSTRFDCSTAEVRL